MEMNIIPSRLGVFVLKLIVAKAEAAPSVWALTRNLG